MSTVKTNLEIDAESRNRIVSDTEVNFFVEAGAGSGKTTMLVNRMVAMVENGRDISKICAITFTKAAAAEFYERFQKLLIERSNPDYVWEDKGYAGQLPAPTEETRARCATALENIDLCYMGTIDGFCNMVLSEHPSEARIPSDAAIISDDEAQALYRQMYVKICQGDFSDELKELSKTFRALNRKAEQVFLKGITLFMNNRNVHFNYSENLTTDLDKTFAAKKAEVISVLACLANHPELKYEGKKESRAAWELLPSALNTLEKHWSRNFSNVVYTLKSLKDLRVLPVGLEKYGPSLGELFEPGGAKGKWLELTDKYFGLCQELEKLQYDVSMTFMAKCVPVLEEVMREKGALTYFDYLYYLRNMLKKDAESEGKLIKYIYNRHSYFLIDEFQDTNPLQAEVFFYLASEKPVAIWNECIPRPGSLFIVGDPKQSIYRFRSADVASFLNVKKLFKGEVGEVLSLSRNFRSTKKMLEYFNDVFQQLLPEETENQSKFEEIPLPDKDKEEFQGVYKYKACSAKAQAAYPELEDSLQIAQIINKLVDNEEYLITSDGDKEPRKIKYSDIMIITYGKKKLGPIMRKLNELAIPTKVEGEVPFYSSEALKAIYEVYAAVADSENQTALYGALTGSLINALPEAVMKFKAEGGRISLYGKNELSDTADTNAIFVADKLKELKELHARALKLSPAALFADILDKFEIFRFVKADNLEVLYYTLELLRNAEAKGIIVSAKDGAAYLAQLLAGESGEERCLSLNDARDCVHMANLHKVKGLEAPVVILAYAYNQDFPATERTEHDTASPEGYIFALESEKDENGRSSVYFSTNEYADKKIAEDDALKAEGKRLIYVAATRARNALILCDSIHFSRGDREIHNSKWNPIMGENIPDFFEALGESQVEYQENSDKVTAAELYDKAKEKCVLCNRDSEVATYELKNPSRIKLVSKFAEEEVVSDAGYSTEATAENEGKKEIGVHSFPTLMGTMTHRLMEVLISTRGLYDTTQAIKEIIREYRTPQSEPYEDIFKTALKKVAATMLKGGYTQENGVPKDIVKLLLDAEECYTEVPFCYKEEENGKVYIWNGVMDVLYKKDGLWHILDYKTNADGTGLDAKYQGQLNAYIKAFKETTGETVEDALIYHIDI